MKHNIRHLIIWALLSVTAFAQSPTTENSAPVSRGSAAATPQPQVNAEPTTQGSLTCCPDMGSLNLIFEQMYNAVASPTPSWQAWSLFDSGAKALGTIFGAVLASILGAGLAARYAYKKWLEEHLTDKWYAILELGIATPEFMNEKKTTRYKQSFKDDQLVKYELFARTCVAFVDHMVNERVKELTPPDGIYCGTGRLLAGRHRAWINDNLVDYNTTFQTWFKKLLKDDPLPLITDEQDEAPNSAAIEDHTSA